MTAERPVSPTAGGQGEERRFEADHGAYAKNMGGRELGTRAKPIYPNRSGVIMKLCPSDREAIGLVPCQLY